MARLYSVVWRILYRMFWTLFPKWPWKITRYGVERKKCKLQQFVGLATNSSELNLWFNWVLLHILQKDNFKRYQAFSHSCLLSCRSNQLIFCIISERSGINYFSSLGVRIWVRGPHNISNNGNNNCNNGRYSHMTIVVVIADVAATAAAVPKIFIPWLKRA